MPRAPHGRRKWTPEEDEIVRAGYSAGVVAPVLAAQLGRTAGSINHRAQRLGVPINPDKIKEHRRSVLNVNSRSPQRAAALSALWTDEMKEKARQTIYQRKPWTYQSRDVVLRAGAIGRAAQIEKRLGWCPVHLRSHYKRLRVPFGREEARRLVLEEWTAQLRRALRQIAAVVPMAIKQAEAERAYRRSFAGQMERVRAGAAVVRKIDLRPPVSHDFSLMGNAEGLM